MTDAPPCLLAVRSVTRAATGLSALATGIVGDDDHDGGYHCGRDGVDSDDYSVKESPRDNAGLTGWASAFDEGMWEKRVNGKTHNLRSHSIWLVAQCKAGTPDSRDIREIIYSPDGKVVRRWDRLGRRTTGDSSHLKHTHRSYFRDATKAGRDLAAIDRRYFAEIGLTAPTTVTAEEKDMAFLVKMRSKPDVWISNGVTRRRLDSNDVYNALMSAGGLKRVDVNSQYELDDAAGPLDPVFAPALPGEVIEGGPVQFTPEVIAALADAVADRFAARLRD